MASPGHTPLKNTDHSETAQRVLEGSVTLLTSKMSLPYYRQPVRGGSLRSLREAFVEEASETADILLDVAAASFGTPTSDDPCVGTHAEQASEVVAKYQTG